MRRGRRFCEVLVLFAVAWAVVGCGAASGEAGETTDQAVEDTLTVFAASSLTDAFGELGDEFERQNPGVTVRFNFAGSSVLLAQLQQGAPADVFASADEAKMKAAEEAGIVSGPRVFARNSPVIVVPADNPAGIEKVRDLAEPGLDLVLAQEGVPIAEYAEEILRRADARYGENFDDRVMKNVVSREADVRAAANRVALGEADATFVYASDVTPEMRDRVEVIRIPGEFSVVASYPIAVVDDAPNEELAREWLKLVLSGEGQRVMGEWGLKRAN